MPLVLGRRIGEKLVLTIDPNTDPQQALRALLEEGIEISVADYDTKRKQVRLSVRAPRAVLVLREELAAGSNDHHKNNDHSVHENLCRRPAPGA